MNVFAFRGFFRCRAGWLERVNRELQGSGIGNSCKLWPSSALANWSYTSRLGPGLDVNVSASVPELKQAHA